jgi:hypothetical protein
MHFGFCMHEVGLNVCSLINGIVRSRTKATEFSLEFSLINSTDPNTPWETLNASASEPISCLSWNLKTQLCSQEPITEPFFEPLEFSLHPPTVFH